MEVVAVLKVAVVALSLRLSLDPFGVTGFLAPDGLLSLAGITCQLGKLSRCKCFIPGLNHGFTLR